MGSWLWLHLADDSTGSRLKLAWNAERATKWSSTILHYHDHTRCRQTECSKQRNSHPVPPDPTNGTQQREHCLLASSRIFVSGKKRKSTIWHANKKARCPTSWVQLSAQPMQAASPSPSQPTLCNTVRHTKIPGPDQTPNHCNSKLGKQSALRYPAPSWLD